MAYHGKLIPDDDFLRSLPAVLNAKQRIALDTLVFASDILDHNWRQLRAGALAVDGEQARVSSAIFAQFFSSAWQIVDQLDLIRQVIGVMLGKDDPAQETEELLERLATARSMRNKMDHLSQNIENLSKRTGPRPGVFGSFSYYLSKSDPPTSGHIGVFKTGQFHGEETMPVADPRGREMRDVVGMYDLSAFDITLQIPECFEALKHWLTNLSEGLEKDISTKCEKIAESEGRDLGSVMASSGGWFSGFFESKFVPPEVGEEMLRRQSQEEE